MNGGTTPSRVPVVVLTGHLGAGKTTVLNHLLRRPGARVGVVVNDFGDINLDAGLVTGQVDEPAAITGGCLCCLEDAGGLDDALHRLTQPRRGLDAVIVEASGLADPVTLARLIRFSGVERVRPGGVVDVIDAVEHFTTVDVGADPPLRYAAASLVVVNKVDRLAPHERTRMLRRLGARVRRRNPRAHVVPAEHGRVDPALVYDTARGEDPQDELPLAALLREQAAGAHRGVEHTHADAVTGTVTGPVDPTALMDLLEEPPAGVYRIKGRLTVRTHGGVRSYVVHVVGRTVHVSSAAGPSDAAPRGELVAIGTDLDTAVVRERLARALVVRDTPDAAGFARLQRRRRLSA